MSFTAFKTWVDDVKLTAAELNEQLRDNGNFLKLNIALEAAVELAIVSGEVTKTQSHHFITSESGVTDDLNTINGGEGDILFLRAYTGHTITLKHGVDNLVSSNGADVDITDSAYAILVHNGTNWIIQAAGLSSADIQDLIDASIDAHELAYDHTLLHSNAITSGDTLPVSPTDGQFFLHTKTNRQILYQYVVDTWYPLVVYGTMTVYVDPVDGTDDVEHGDGIDTDAFATLQYALNIINPNTICNDGFTINLIAGEYTASLTDYKFSGLLTITGVYPTTVITTCEVIRCQTQITFANMKIWQTVIEDSNRVNFDTGYLGTQGEMIDEYVLDISRSYVYAHDTYSEAFYQATKFLRVSAGFLSLDTCTIDGHWGEIRDIIGVNVRNNAVLIVNLVTFVDCRYGIGCYYGGIYHDILGNTVYTNCGTDPVSINTHGDYILTTQGAYGLGMWVDDDEFIAGSNDRFPSASSVKNFVNSRAPKCKLDATVPPDADNDTTEGYLVGSRWIDITADKAYTCVDATTGAAVWLECAGGAGGGDMTKAVYDTDADGIIDAAAIPANTGLLWAIVFS